MNNRQFHRIHFSQPAVLSQGNQTWHTTLLDLSLHGALLVCPVQFATEQENDLVTLTFQLDEYQSPIIVHGKLAHRNNTQVGVEFKSLDIESMTQLRQLVAHNLGDQALLARDFSALLDQQ